ncbi:MAG: hydrogenase 4 subunit D [Candidatus Edwardsbacteria bacterium]
MILLFSLALILPFLTAFLVGGMKRKASSSFSIVMTLVTLICAMVGVIRIFPHKIEYILVNWSWLETHRGIFGFFLDPLSSLMLIVITVIGFLVVLYSLRYIGPDNRDHPLHHGESRYYFWLLLFIGSMIGVVTAPNFLQLFVFWELTTLCSWALISFYRTEEGLTAGFKALTMTYIGGIFFLLGLVILFVATKSFSFDAINLLSPSRKTIVFILFLIAAWAKSSQIPFYTWLPDAMAAPTTISCYLHAAAMVKAGVYLIARTFISVSGISWATGLIVSFGAILTMLVALFFFFFQDDLKRLLAYSTIAHLGYILLGVGLGILGSSIGFQGGVLHIICHAFAKGLLFLTVGVIAYAAGTKSIKRLQGLSHTMPLVTVAFLVGICAVTGIPPFSCFWSKFFLITGSLQIGGLIGILILIPFIVEVVLAFAWFFFVGQKIFFGEPSDSAWKVQRIPWSMSFVLIVLMAFCLIAPLIGMSIVKMIHLSP